jgi:hypothetical protein
MWLILLAGAGYDPRYPDETNPDPMDEAVALRFDWPIGLACETTARTERTGRTPGTSLVTERWGVRGHAEGRLLHQDAVSLQVLSPTTPLAADAEGAATFLAARAPDRVVALDASFRRLDNLEAWRASLDEAWRAEAARLPSPAELPASLLDARGLQARLSHAWDAEIGFWHGQKLPVAATSMAVVLAPAAMLPGTSMQWMYRFRIARSLPCPTGGATCVELVYDASPGKADLLRALAAAGPQLLPAEAMAGGQVATWLNPKLTVHAELIAEPGALVPHHAYRETVLEAEAKLGERSFFLADGERRTADTTCRRP